MYRFVFCFFLEGKNPYSVIRYSGTGALHMSPAPPLLKLGIVKIFVSCVGGDGDVCEVDRARVKQRVNGEVSTILTS
jgi:hypothetical protein